MKKRLYALVGAALLLSALLPGVSAAENTYAGKPPSAAAEGYIVRLKSSGEGTVSLMAAPDLREISAEAGLYRVDGPDEIAALGDRVAYYEPDSIVTLSAQPNDTYLQKQWSIGYLGADVAWDAGYSGAGVRVAVIDSGVNSMHEDFEGVEFARGLNVLNGSHDVTDENGHGTAVSGVLAAARNNGLGVAGLCSDLTVVPLKCFSDSNETYASYIIEAIYAAVDEFDCDVLNLSLGTDVNTKSMQDAVQHAASKGAIVVSAAGNMGTSKLHYPAAYDGVIGVGAIDRDGLVADFSQKNGSVFVTAPGKDVISLSYRDEKEYALWNGTSISTPFVAAAAAMLKQYAPAATVDDFEKLLIASSTDAGEKGYDSSYGYGILNFRSFITMMEGESGGFTDTLGHWANEGINFCVQSGYFTGMTSTTFEPETLMNRAMFVTVLSRMSREDISGYANGFTDVPTDAWYSQPANWGAAKGIVNGMGEARFAPMVSITREQLASLLYRYAVTYGIMTGAQDASVLQSFDDESKVSGWAREPMAWAVSNGLLTGRTATTLAPQEGAKRCEVATIILRFVNTFGSHL